MANRDPKRRRVSGKRRRRRRGFLEQIRDAFGLTSLNLRYVATILAVIFVIAIVLVVHNGMERITYHSYEVIREESKTGATTQYEYMDGRILRYSIDGATLLKDDFSVIWTDSYTMTNPKAVTEDDMLLIYDSLGTSCHIYQGENQVNSFETKLPIVTAKISAGGNVAVVMRDGVRTQFVYYSSAGVMLASGAATMEDPGYPAGIAISPDGKYVALAYITVSGGKGGTLIRIFDFSDYNSSDENRIAETLEYEGVLAPEIYYPDNSHFVVVREDGFDKYKGRSTFELEKSVEFENEIIGNFHDGRNLVFLFRNESGTSSYLMQIYTQDGESVNDEEIELQYKTADISRDTMIFYKDNHLQLYSMRGQCKFEGDITEGNISDVLKISRNRYLIITDEKMELIQLK